MCKFASAISNGEDKVAFFKLEDIINETAKGNPKNYEWNSHTSIAHFIGLTAEQEDNWNKWEYNPDTKEITPDSLVAKDDRKKVKEVLEKYLKDKDIVLMRNLYNKNSGNRNSGDGNSGNGNSGNGNSGNRNSGDGNSGDRNSGKWNSGDGNSGDRNSGDGNSGDGNSGKWNSGNGNSGNRNSGDGNSGCIIGHFSSKKMYFLFNKPCTEEEAQKVYELGLWQYFDLEKWIAESEMTEKEKADNPTYKTTGGYLKTFTYKEAWANVPKKKLQEIEGLKNFNKKVFKEISGLDI